MDNCQDHVRKDCKFLVLHLLTKTHCTTETKISKKVSIPFRDLSHTQTTKHDRKSQNGIYCLCRHWWLFLSSTVADLSYLQRYHM